MSRSVEPTRMTSCRAFSGLEAHGFEVWLVNAKDVKHLPGRPKTDLLTELLGRPGWCTGPLAGPPT